MAHFAKLDGNNRVTEVIVVNNAVLLDDAGQESEERGVTFLRMMYGHANWRQTSYNGAFRKFFAAPGMIYYPEVTVLRTGYLADRVDAFLPPAPTSGEYVWSDDINEWVIR